MCLRPTKTFGVKLKIMSAADLTTLSTETISATLSDLGENGSSTDELYAAVTYSDALIGR